MKTRILFILLLYTGTIYGRRATLFDRLQDIRKLRFEQFERSVRSLNTNYFGTRQTSVQNQVNPARQNREVDAWGAVASNTTQRISLQVFGAAYCPDTTVFLQQQLDSAVFGSGAQASLSNIFDLQYVAFGKGYCRQSGDDYWCTCQHGPAECSVNALMNCVQMRMPLEHQWYPLISCIQAKSMVSAKQCFISAGLDPTAFIQCAEGKEGRRLLAHAASITNSLSPRLRRIPWVLLNGQRQLGYEFGLRRSLCTIYGNRAPC